MNDIGKEILRAARVLFRPGDLVEIRVPQARQQHTISGYFTDLEKLAAAAASLERSRYPGVYWTLNPARQDLGLIARADHKLAPFARATTSDPDILERRWLPADFDPVRPAGISSSDAEKQAALEVADRATEWLTSLGWPAPLRADSGNGWHRVHALALPNDAESTELIHHVLQALAARFNTPQCKVDVGIANPARIFKVWGTMARKGDDTKERPHRPSRLVEVPEPAVEVVPIALLREVAAMAPTPINKTRAGAARPTGRGQAFEVQRFLDEHGVRYRGPVSDPRGRKWVLEACPFDSSHKDPDAAVFELTDGSFGFHCFHNSCQGRVWRDFREFFEPDAPRGLRRPLRVPAPVATSAPAEETRVDDPPAELALSEADVEAAIDEAIAGDDVLAAIRLAPEVGRQRAVQQELLVAKLKLRFKGKFSESGFRRAMKDVAPAADGDGTGQPPHPPAADEGAGAPPPAGLDLLDYPFTDAGNGERIRVLFGPRIRYCNEMKKWLVWDGRRWCVDEFDLMRQMGKQMARLLYAQAAMLPDGSFRKVVEKHARASESYASISAALGMAASEPGVRVAASQLDQHPYLLNCSNGLVDLRSGKLTPHQAPEDPEHEKRMQRLLITKLCPVAYQRDAVCPRFHAFIEWAMGSKNEEAELTPTTARLVGFLQRALGYGLTGDVSAKVVFVFYGEGGDNGKTTLLTLFREMLGPDYASLLMIETIMAAKQTDTTARSDVADLRGARFVQTSEVGKEDKLNEQRVKYLTQGMGFIKSRRLYENPIEFEATHKLFMDCNYRPGVRQGDDATWRRLKLVPFLVTIEEEKKDPELKLKLRAEEEGILAWTVRGTMEWFKHGLGEPPEVQAAVADWREHDDPVAEFLEDCCELEKTAFVTVSDLRAGYQWWAKDAGEKFILNRVAFNDWLKKKKLCQDRERICGKQERIWRGVELKTHVTSAIRRASNFTETFRETD
jgi:P4 family phage/plasmid primase-like protien